VVRFAPRRGGWYRQVSKSTNQCGIHHRQIRTQGRQGDLGAATFPAERAEGRPSVSISHDGDGDNLAIIVAHMHERSEGLGPPEGFIPRLPEGEDEEAAQ
jgi:hypothetical protein